jgi:adenosylcobyric acid synthase
VIIEGAGSAAELNLRDGEIVNMAVAKHAQAPVLLAGDIDRGGIFAQLLGTLWLLDDEERALVKGLIVNKFRGDIRLFADGVRMIEERGGVPVVGVVPYLVHDLPEEDAVAIERQNTPQAGQAAGIDIAVIRLPRISNFDDFDPLDAEPDVGVRYAGSVEELGAPDAVIIPGTKSTMADLDWLRAGGLAEAIAGHAARGGAVVGICGGYQMLGRVIRDPDHSESPLDEADGLGLLPVETTFRGEKATHQARATVRGDGGWLAAVSGGTVTGYEIHMGRTHGPGGAAWLEIDRRGGAETSVADGAISPEGHVWGCYLHGLFENDGLRRAWLGSLGWQGADDGPGADARLEASFDALADALEGTLDMARIDAMVGM